MRQDVETLLLQAELNQEQGRNIDESLDLLQKAYNLQRQVVGMV
jgi:hypothetical protein